MNPTDSRLPPLAAEDHRCETCGLSYPATTLDFSLGTIATLPHRLRQTVENVPADVLRACPDPRTWSALEYLCHIRDVLATSTIRLYRTRTEDDPAIEPIFNDLRAVRFRYNARNTGAVLDEIGDNAEGFREEASRMPPEGWHRRLHRLPLESRSALWLVRQGMHEGEHHLRDIQRVTGLV